MKKDAIPYLIILMITLTVSNIAIWTLSHTGTNKETVTFTITADYNKYTRECFQAWRTDIDPPIKVGKCRYYIDSLNTQSAIDDIEDYADLYNLNYKLVDK